MEKRSNRKLAPLLLFAGGFLIPLAFAIYTRHAWEDWYITYRASKNLALGNGLLFTVGQRVHSFTSPLGVLIPALLAWLTGNDDAVLWLFRIFNCALLGTTALWLWKIAQHLQLGGWAIFLLLGMFMLESKVVDFSINGMETGIMVFFLGLALYGIILPVQRRGLLLGLACAGLMWTRPDGFVYFGAIGLGFLLFCPGCPRGTLVRQFVWAGVVATVLYGPWLVWAWSYYGSFVPHTVVAKGLVGRPSSETLMDVLLFPWAGLISPTSFDRLLMPSYAELGGWPVWLAIASRVLSWPCAFAWAFPKVKRVTRAMSFALLVAILYLNFVAPAYPWYLPCTALLSIVALALLFQQALDGAPKLIVALRPAAMAVVVGTLGVLLAVAWQLRIQQAVVEEGNRKAVGLWLREHAVAPTDRVFLECLGYIGFYSNLKMYDYPGLASPEMVAARRAIRSDDFGQLIDYLRPEWLVLRPFEIFNILRSKPSLFESVYAPARVFSVAAKVASCRFLPGRGYLEYDRELVVLKRRDWPASVPAAEDATHLREALEVQASLAEAQNLGVALLRDGQVDEAMAQFRKALEIQPNDAEVYNNLGLTLLRKGRMDEAIAYFQKALELRPDYVNAHYNFALALLQKGRTDEATAHFEKVLATEPKNAEVHFALADIFLQEQQLNEAITHFQKAVELQPDNARAWNNLGNALLRQGRRAEAVVQFRKALKLQPGNAAVAINLAWVLATCPDAAGRDGAQAVALAQGASHRSDGENPMVLRTLAAAYAETGRFAEAIATVQQAIELAKAQTNTVLATGLEAHLKLYQAGSPLRDTAQIGIPAIPVRP